MRTPHLPPFSSPSSGDSHLPWLSAFFPVRNEEANVVPMAESLLRVLPRVATRWELLIVDDGSTDRTGVLADEIALRHANVRVIRHPVGRGYGAALRTGLDATRGDWVFFTDGDRQFDPTQLVALLPHVGSADAVVGYRHRRSDPLGRRVNGAAWNALVRVLFGLPVRDVNCAFKLLRRRALAGIALSSRGATISAELLIGLRRRGRRVVEVPVDHFPRRAGRASGARLAVIARAFGELLALGWRIRLERARPSPTTRAAHEQAHAACELREETSASGGAASQVAGQGSRTQIA